MFDLERDIFGGHWNYVFARLTDDITNEGWQDHATPETVCNCMIDKYQYKQTDKILVLFNAELINALHKKYADEIIYSNIYYIADTEKKYNYIKKYLPKVNCKYLNKEDWSPDKLFEIIKEFNMPKHFDVVFSNPPYSITGGRGGTDEEKNIDLIFLEEVFKQSNRVCFVMTARFMVREDMKQKRLDLSKYCESITLFNGNDDFKINFPYPLCIIVLNKNKNANELIKITDNYYLKTTYKVSNLDHFNKYGFEEEEYTWWKDFINTLSNHSERDEAYYLGHCVGWKQFNAPLGFFLGSAVSIRVNVKDVVTFESNTTHIFSNKNRVVNNLDAETIEKRNNEFFIVPINTQQEGININMSYKEEIIRAIVDETKARQRLYKCTVITLPWPADQNGNIKYFTNDDWIKKLNIKDSVANKIINYYNNHPELAIQK